MEDSIEYCEICDGPITEKDDVYEGIWNFCGDENAVDQSQNDETGE